MVLWTEAELEEINSLNDISFEDDKPLTFIPEWLLDARKSVSVQDFISEECSRG